MKRDYRGQSERDPDTGETTNWTIYADTLLPLEEKSTEKPASSQNKATITQTSKLKSE